MVAPALVLGSRLAVRFAALSLPMLGKRPAPAAPHVEPPRALRGEPPALMGPGDEEPTWEDAEWR
ncbi:MAG: hypothetical protein M3Q71_14325 [Chloroflexota bacterium]|nr:hypothetical protein [Chloroflexota bacterium]MDP9471816.1 hypothetical protein [Chloroflexota bacterium]